MTTLPTIIKFMDTTKTLRKHIEEYSMDDIFHIFHFEPDGTRSSLSPTYLLKDDVVTLQRQFVSTPKETTVTAKISVGRMNASNCCFTQTYTDWALAPNKVPTAQMRIVCTKPKI